MKEVVDSNLIQQEKQKLYAKEECVLSILGLGLDCLVDAPQERINMRDIVSRLKMIKETLQKNVQK